MVALLPKNEIEAICTCVALSLGYSSLREQQKDVVTNFVAGSDVFAILPTGYSKSLCYACLPGTFDKLLNVTNSLYHIHNQNNMSSSSLLCVT